MFECFGGCDRVSLVDETKIESDQARSLPEGRMELLGARGGCSERGERVEGVEGSKESELKAVENVSYPAGAVAGDDRSR